MEQEGGAMRLINADELYEQTAKWEQHAMEQVAKYSPADNRDLWRWWNAILMERTSFKHDIMDAPTIESRNRGEWSPDTTYYGDRQHSYTMYKCSCCGSLYMSMTVYCPHCGARMQRRDDL